MKPVHYHAPWTPFSMSSFALYPPVSAPVIATLVLVMTTFVGCLQPTSGGLTGNVDNVSPEGVGLDVTGPGDAASQETGNDIANDSKYDVETQGKDIAGDASVEAFVDTPSCEPSCFGKVCGDDGCGAMCGNCASGEACEAGTCVELVCPQPLIKVEEGQNVIPQTILHLSAVNADGSAASLSSYQWSVLQPSGGTSLFQPSTANPNPTFAVNIAGHYTFTLDVPSPVGTDLKCPSYEYDVAVTPTQGIHVELIWLTPGDVDETDTGPEQGSDLDLHFAHELAVNGVDIDGDGTGDPWFHALYDCYWNNDEPKWGLYSASQDDARLDRDDTDGAGPENLNVVTPEDSVTYSVGVHYYDDHGFGPAFATIRIYIFGELKAEFGHVELASDDFWRVATITSTSGAVTIEPGSLDEPDIVHTVPNPFFP